MASRASYQRFVLKGAAALYKCWRGATAKGFKRPTTTGFAARSVYGGKEWSRALLSVLCDAGDAEEPVDQNDELAACKALANAWEMS